MGSWSGHGPSVRGGGGVDQAIENLPAFSHLARGEAIIGVKFEKDGSPYFFPRLTLLAKLGLVILASSGASVALPRLASRCAGIRDTNRPCHLPGIVPEVSTLSGSPVWPHGAVT